MQIYDDIGAGYRGTRRPDPRIADSIHAALAGCERVLNVGAGAGSYEPAGALAVEPSWTMIEQRAQAASPVVRGRAEALPFADLSVAATLAILTLHHWSELEVGLSEMRRVARDRVVLYTWDPDGPTWWFCDYWPELVEIDRRIFPSVGRIEAALGSCRVEVVMIPHDCCDGFLGAFWRRPAAYLEESVRAGMSTFAKLSPEAVIEGVERLASDLRDGSFEERHREVLGRSSFDLGYRLVIAD